MLDEFSYQILADSAYYNTYKSAIDCKQIGETYNNHKNGFRAKVFMSKNGEIVIAYSGTHIKSLADISNDINMAIGNLPPQAEDAIALYNKIREQYPNAKISLTGHSLGGSLAQIVAKTTGVPALVFNPFSTGNDGGKDYPNITNIIHSEDFIAMCDINTQPGKILVIPNKSGNILMPRLFSSLEPHSLLGMDLFDLQPYTRGSIKSFMDRMNEGETHPNLYATRNVLSEVYADWDNSQAKTFFHNALNTIDKVKIFKDKVKSNISNFITKLQGKPTGYATNIQNGRWVTIDGNHVFIENK